MNDYDYSKTIFSQGVVCFNTNNQRYCVVIDGARGSENDRGSMVIEFTGDEGYMIHTPPNRALIPTGRICKLENLKKVLNNEVSE